MLHHVLHILETGRQEGAASVRIVAPLVCGLDAQRYKVHAWFLAGGGPLAAELLRAGASVRVMNWWRGARHPWGAWRFWRALREEDFSIIHQHFGGRSIRWLARSATQASILVHLHGRVLEARGPAPLPILVQTADAVVANSLAVAKQVVGRKAYVVYPGVDVAEGLNLESVDRGGSTGKVVGTAGRLVPVKGMVHLLRAFALLRADVPDVLLEIAGSGPEQKGLESEVEKLGLKECVTFLGWETALAPLLAKWDVYVQPSLEEGFGLAALEAMAAGLPVIASAVGGLPELVVEGQTGWLIPPGDTQALASRLHALVVDPVQRRAMGVAGRARAQEHFSTERMVAAISEIYEILLAKR